MSWASEAAASLLPLSKEKKSLEKALKEWYYTNQFEDLEEAIEICQLCQHPDIRYQFEIGNRNNGNTLLIGSECITKFGIDVLDDKGIRLDKDKARSKVLSHRRQLIEEAKQKRAIRALVELGAKKSWFAERMDSFIGYYQDKDGFTPKQLLVVLKGFREHGIEHRPTDYKVKIKRHDWRNQITEEMAASERNIIWGSLTASQQKAVEKRMDELAKWKRMRRESGHND